MINKSYKYGYIAAIIISIILMAVGAKFDYTITETLYNPSNIFGILFEAFAYLPIYLFAPVLGACVMVRNQNKMTTFSIGAVMLIGSCGAFAYVGALHMAQRQLISKANPYYCGIIGGLAAALMFIAVRRLKKPIIRKIQAMCAFAFAYMACETAAVVIVKKIFGRDRYEDIIKGGEYVFAHWFKPVFFSDGSSFPSGHTAAAMGIMVILLLPFLFKTFQNQKLPLFIFCYFYVGLMAFSRLIMGKHFLSDTGAAILIMTVLFMALTPAFEKIYKRELLK